MPADLITATEAGALIGVSARTFRSYVARGIAGCPLPVTRLGTTPLWDREAVLAWHRARPRRGEG